MQGAVTQQSFKLKETGCQNSMVGILNTRLQIIWEAGWKGDVTVVTLLGPCTTDQTSSSYLGILKLLPGCPLSQPPNDRT